MGKYTRKCRTIGDVEKMEVTQVVGVRTRARTLALAAAKAAAVEVGGNPKKRKAAAAGSQAGKLQIAYLELRNRKLVMPQRESISVKNFAEQPCGSVKGDRISRCSIFSSCEPVDEDDLQRLNVVGQKNNEDLRSSVCCFERSGNRRVFIPSCHDVIESNETDSTAERKFLQTMPEMVPSSAEIEDFFAAAERVEKQRFAARYNFDVNDDIPLEGRYEWVRINP